MGQDVEWFWTDIHDNVIKQVKQLATRAPIFKYLDVAKDTTMQYNASERALGAVILQEGHPVVHAS